MFNKIKAWFNYFMDREGHFGFCPKCDGSMHLIHGEYQCIDCNWGLKRP